MSTPHVPAVALAVSAMLVLASCAQRPEADVLPPDDSPPPAFVGVFAEEYREAWVDSRNSFVHQVIEGERITAQEWAEVEARLTDCLARQGIRFREFDQYGGYSADVGDISMEVANPLFGACEAYSGEAYIGWLRMQAILNPENRDDHELILECLVRAGAVPAAYSVEEFRRDMPDRSFPYVDAREGEEIFWDCNADPLSLLPSK